MYIYMYMYITILVSEFIILAHPSLSNLSLSGFVHTAIYGDAKTLDQWIFCELSLDLRSAGRLIQVGELMYTHV